MTEPGGGRVRAVVDGDLPQIVARHHWTFGPGAAPQARLLPRSGLALAGLRSGRSQPTHGSGVGGQVSDQDPPVDLEADSRHPAPDSKRHLTPGREMPVRS